MKFLDKIFPKKDKSDQVIYNSVLSDFIFDWCKINSVNIESFIDSEINPFFEVIISKYKNNQYFKENENDIRTYIIFKYLTFKILVEEESLLKKINLISILNPAERHYDEINLYNLESSGFEVFDPNFEVLNALKSEGVLLSKVLSYIFFRNKFERFDNYLSKDSFKYAFHSLIYTLDMQTKSTV